MSTNEQTTPQISIATIIREKLSTGKIVRSAEIIPPRNGMETTALFQQIEALKTVPVDFISVTKGAGGSLRGGTLPIAQIIKTQFGICSLAHFTCRDYTTPEIENNLMDHHYFGVSNILALRGDPPDGQPDHFKPAPNRHSYAYQLVDQIRKLNHGEYLTRAGFDAEGKPKTGVSTNFSIGVAAHPAFEPFEKGVEYLKQKVEMGGQFAITQMIFSAEIYAKFLDACAKQGIRIPILPGIRIITQAATAERMMSKFSDVHIPDALINDLRSAPSKEDGKKIGFAYAEKLCRDLIKAGAPGLHVFVMSDAKSGAELLKEFR